jgi:chromosomal replication initiation ATPase DnaA
MLSSTTDTYTDISPTDSAPDTAALAIFRAALADIIPHIRKPDFLTYFKKFSVVASTPESITFGVASAFHRDNIIAKFYDMLRTSISRISPAVCTLDFVVDEHIETRSPEYVVDCRTEMDTAAKKLKTEQIHGVEVVEGLNSRLINTKYKLDNFIVGPANQLAHAASDAVSRRPGSAYNPLYIYGNV